MSSLKKPNIIKVTDEALKKTRELLSEKQDVCGIRVGVKSGGCSGLSYVIEYAKTLGTFDEQVIVDDVTILIDKKAVLYLIGSTMDYVEEQFKSGFVFVNPKEKMKCGCGKSFSI